jgi:excisionase family DNA binding protein
VSGLNVINTYYTVNDLAQQLQVHVETIRREIRREKLKCFYVGNEPRFTQQHVDDYAGVMRYGKTSREIALEKQVQALEFALFERDNFITLIKNEILKIAQT